MEEKLKIEQYKNFTIKFDVKYIKGKRVIFADVKVPDKIFTYAQKLEIQNTIRDMFWKNKKEALLDIKDMIDKYSDFELTRDEVYESIRDEVEHYDRRKTSDFIWKHHSDRKYYVNRINLYYNDIDIGFIWIDSNFKDKGEILCNASISDEISSIRSKRFNREVVNKLERSLKSTRTVFRKIQNLDELSKVFDYILQLVTFFEKRAKELVKSEIDHKKILKELQNIFQYVDEWKGSEEESSYMLDAQIKYVKDALENTPYEKDELFKRLVKQENLAFFKGNLMKLIDMVKKEIR